MCKDLVSLQVVSTKTAQLHICAAATARDLLEEGKAKVLREPLTIILLS
jgi:hypothetical protein